MSKLIDETCIEYMRERKPVLRRTTAEVSYSLGAPNSHAEASYADVYEMRVVLRTRFAVEYGSESLEKGKKRAREQMAWFVFAEFKPTIMRLREALLNYDVKDAYTIVDELEKQMFEV